MAKFTVNFSAPVKSANFKGGPVTIGSTSNGATPKPLEAEPTPEPEVAPVETVSPQAVKSALANVLSELDSQRLSLHSIAANYALEIMRVFLNSTDEVIEQRLKENVTRILEDTDDFEFANIHVHSNCREAIQNWIVESNTFDAFNGKVEVLGDDQLQEGDCRVDFGQSARLASFDEQLKLVESRLMDLVRIEQNGAGQ